MPLGRKIAVPPILLHDCSHLSDSNKSKADHGAAGFHYRGRDPVHKTGSGSSQFPFLYCLAAYDSSLKRSGKHSFLHSLSEYGIEWILS